MHLVAPIITASDSNDSLRPSVKCTYPNSATVFETTEVAIKRAGPMGSGRPVVVVGVGVVVVVMVCYSPFAFLSLFTLEPLGLDLFRCMILGSDR